VSKGATIFALSSGRPPAAIAVIRLSGAQAGAALLELAGRAPPERRASLMWLRDPSDGGVLDHAVVLWLPGPNTATGEDMVELHIHGGAAVIAAVLGALGRLTGLRMAEAGEFTRRAFESGRLDLTAVEGLADLIMAHTEAQRRQAVRQFQGKMGEAVEGWRRQLISAMALIEASIDFGDEGDVPDDLVGPALRIAGELRSALLLALEDGGRGERLRDGLSVAIAGPPNAGKSSLLNRIARREAAIVSPVAGTTRDVIEVALDLEGYPVSVMDMAGIHVASDAIEQEGVRRARARTQAADLVLWVVDGSQNGAETIATARVSRGRLWLVRNKIDLVDSDTKRKLEPVPEAVAAGFAVSAVTGEGVAALVAGLSRWARETLSGGEPSVVTRARHRASLEEALEALERALAQGAADEEAMMAEELRLAARALGKLLGRVDVEDILDVIFRDFCIGK
jgi:tRNA modification GTPase